MVLIDVNNVLHASRDARDPDALARLLTGVLASRYGSRRIIAVCDGSPGKLSPGAQASLVRLLAGRSNCRVLYSGPEQEADDLIETLISEAPEGAQLLVVSSDGRLALAAYRVGAMSLSAKEFLGAIGKDRAKAAAREAGQDDPLDPGSVAWWMGYFGMGPARAKPREFKPAPRESEIPATPPLGAAGRLKRPSSGSSDWLAEAMRMWPDQIKPEDLNMELWLKEKKSRRKK